MSKKWGRKIVGDMHNYMEEQKIVEKERNPRDYIHTPG